MSDWRKNTLRGVAILMLALALLISLAGMVQAEVANPEHGLAGHVHTPECVDYEGTAAIIALLIDILLSLIGGSL